MGHWVDGFLKTGTPLGEVMEITASWLRQKCSVEALRVASAVIIHAGRRPHLELLAVEALQSDEEAIAIRSNTAFAVKRRTLV
jgi:hypothetical protein